jgi:hypothetical protein
VDELDSSQEQSAHESMMKWLIERGQFTVEQFSGFMEAAATLGKNGLNSGRTARRHKQSQIAPTVRKSRPLQKAQRMGHPPRAD